jgi:hypothetical protein
MDSKDRIQHALNHRPGGEIPIDLGSTGVTGIHVSCVESLRQYYGLGSDPIKVIEPYQMLGEVAADLGDVIGIDTTSVNPRETLFGFPNEDWQEYQTPWGQTVLVSGQFRTRIDARGDTYIYPKGDVNAAPSGRLPDGGYFFDTIIRQPPLDEENLDPEDNLEEFDLISDEDLSFFKTEAEHKSGEGKGVIANFGGTAFGDIALVPAPFLTAPRGIRDVEEWYISTAIRPDHIHAIYSKQCEIALDNLEKIYANVGDLVDVVFLCGTDFGTQTSSFCSTETFQSLWLPYYKKINDWIHDNTGWKTFKHSCGAVEMFMPHFIEAGFDIINPVQCSAAGMEPRALKAKYGDQLVFWGGGVDTQSTLPFQSPQAVREQVLERCDIFSKNGGFVFNTIHNIQACTPVDNIVAMLEAVAEFR